MFSMSFDPKSLSEIAQFAGWSVYLSDEVQQALSEGGSLLVDAARGAMHWQNPTGALEESIHAIPESKTDLLVGSDLIYARRRNWGFNGADSLGRVYHDQGAFFMETAMDQEQSTILASVEDAVSRACNRLGAS